mgnify:CR=1 FL=1
MTCDCCYSRAEAAEVLGVTDRQVGMLASNYLVSPGRFMSCGLTRQSVDRFASDVERIERATGVRISEAGNMVELVRMLVGATQQRP